jgi:hypothetical protein
MRWIFSLGLAAVTVASLAGGEPAAGRQYDLRLERPLRQGQVLTISQRVDSTLVYRLQVGEQLQPRKVERQLRLECRLSVRRAKDERWEELEVTPTVASEDRNGIKTKLEPLGQPLLVTRAGDVLTFGWADGTALKGAEADLLRSFFHEASPSTSDAAFGPGRPVAVGDEWPVNPDQVSAMFNATGTRLQVRPENVHGRFRLEAVDPATGLLRVKGTVEFKDVVAAAQKLTAVKLDKAGITMNIEYELPVDPELTSRTARLEVDWGYEGAQQREDGAMVRESLRHHSVRQETMKPAEPTPPPEEKK